MQKLGNVHVPVVGLGINAIKHVRMDSMVTIVKKNV